MAGCYIVFEHPHGTASPHDIGFQLVVGFTGEIPADQSNLKSEVERTLDVLGARFAPDSMKFQRYFKELLALSQYGLVGESAQPLQALDTLRNLQKRIFDAEKGTAISAHMRAIMKPQIILLAASVAIGAAAVGAVKLAWLNDVTTFFPYFAILPGLFVGLTFSAFMRCRAVTFFDLHAIEADRFSPWMKVAFAIVTTAIAAVFLKAQLVEISIGKANLSNFDKDLLSAFVFGIVLGVAQELAISWIESIQKSAAKDKSSPPASSNS